MIDERARQGNPPPDMIRQADSIRSIGDLDRRGPLLQKPGFPAP
jgi:hypothetical protein